MPTEPTTPRQVCLEPRGGEVREGFRRLREELRSLEPPAWPAGSGCPALESRNR
jgi:hypothetical protein